MLIRERLEEGDFSNRERAIVDFILKKKLEIRDMTTKEIAQGVFASPSTFNKIEMSVYGSLFFGLLYSGRDAGCCKGVY